MVGLELAMTAALVRGYPALERGLGLSKACASTVLQICILFVLRFSYNVSLI